MRKLVAILITIVTLAAQAQTSYYQMDITIDGRTIHADMAANKATAELKALLESGSITVDLHEYGGFERVGSLPRSFTTSDQHINADTGDIMLYLGNQIVFMLGANSWSYTRLGHINADRATLESFFGSGNSKVTLSLPNASVETIINTDSTDVEYYDLQGRKITGEPHGLVIKKKGNKATKVFKK